MKRIRRSATNIHSKKDSVRSGNVIKSKYKTSKKLIGVKRIVKGKTSKQKDIKLTAAEILLTDTASIISTTSLKNKITKKMSVRKIVEQKSVSTQTNKIFLKSLIKTAENIYSPVVKHVGNNGKMKQTTKYFHIQKKVSKISVGSSGTIQAGLQNSTVFEDNITDVSPLTGSRLEIIKKRKDQVETPVKVESSSFGKMQKKKNNKISHQIKSKSPHNSSRKPKSSIKQIDKVSSSKTLRNGKVAERYDTPAAGQEVQRMGIVKENTDKTATSPLKKSNTRNTQKSSARHAGKAQRKTKSAKKHQIEIVQTSKIFAKKSSKRQSDTLQTSPVKSVTNVTPVKPVTNVAPVKPTIKKSHVSVTDYLDNSDPGDEDILYSIGFNNFDENQKSAPKGDSDTKRYARVLVSPKQIKSRRNLPQSFLLSSTKGKSLRILNVQNFSTSVRNDSEDVTVHDNLNNLENSPQRGRNARKETRLSKEKQRKQSKLSKNIAKKSSPSRNQMFPTPSQKGILKLSTPRVNKIKSTFDESKSAFVTVCDIPIRVRKRQRSDNIEAEALPSKKQRTSHSSLRIDLKLLLTKKQKSLSHVVKVTPKQSVTRKKKKTSKSESQLNKIANNLIQSEKQNLPPTSTIINHKQSKAKVSSSQETVPESAKRETSLETRKKVKKLTQARKKVKKLTTVQKQKSVTSAKNTPMLSELKKYMSPVNTKVKLLPSNGEEKHGLKKNTALAQTKYSKKSGSVVYERSSKHYFRKKGSNLISPKKLQTPSTIKFPLRKKSPKTSRIALRKSQPFALAVSKKNKSERNKIIDTTFSLRKKQAPKLKKHSMLSATLEETKLFSPKQKRAGRGRATKREMSPEYKEQENAPKTLRSSKTQVRTFSTTPRKAISAEEKKMASITRGKILSNKSPKLTEARKSLTPRRTSLYMAAEKEKIRVSPQKNEALKIYRTDTQVITFSASPEKAVTPRKKKTNKILVSKKGPVKMKTKIFSSSTLRRTRMGKNSEREEIPLLFPKLKESSKSLSGGVHKQKTTSCALPKKGVSQEKKQTKLTADIILSNKKRPKVSLKSKARKSLSRTLRKIRLDKILVSGNIHLVSEGQKVSSKRGINQIGKTIFPASPKKTTTRTKKIAKPTSGKILAHKKSPKVLPNTNTRKSHKQMPEMSTLDEAAVIEKSHQILPGKKKVLKSHPDRNQTVETTFASPNEKTSSRKKKTAKVSKVSVKTGLKKSFSLTTKRTRLSKTTALEKLHLISPGKKEASRPLIVATQIQRTRTSASGKQTASQEIKKTSNPSKKLKNKKILTIVARKSLTQTPRKTKLYWTTENEKIILIHPGGHNNASTLIPDRKETREINSNVSPKNSATSGKMKTAKLMSHKVFSNKKNPKFSGKTEVIKSFSPSKRIRPHRIAKAYNISQVSLQEKTRLRGRNHIQKISSSISKKHPVSPGKKFTSDKIIVRKKSPNLATTVKVKKSISPTLRTTGLGKTSEIEAVHLISLKQKGSSKSLSEQFHKQKSTSSPIQKKRVSLQKWKKPKLMSDKIFSVKMSPKLSTKLKDRKLLSRKLRRTRLDKVLGSENINPVSPDQKVASKNVPGGNYIKKNTSARLPKASPRNKKPKNPKRDNIFAIMKKLNDLSNTEVRTSFQSVPGVTVEKMHQVSSEKKSAAKSLLDRKQMLKVPSSSLSNKVTSPWKKKTAGLTSGKIISNKKNSKLATKMKARKSHSPAQNSNRPRISKIKKISLISPKQKKASKTSHGFHMSKTASSSSSKKVVSLEKESTPKLSSNKTLSHKKSPNSSAKLTVRRSLFSPASKRLELDRVAKIENISLISSRPLSARKRVKKARSTAVPKKSNIKSVSTAQKRNKQVKSEERAIHNSVKKAYKKSPKMTKSNMTKSLFQNYSTASPTHLIASYARHGIEFPSSTLTAAETPSRILDIYSKQSASTSSLGRKIAESSTKSEIINSRLDSKTHLSKIMVYSKKAKSTSHEFSVRPPFVEKVGSSYIRHNRISPSPENARTESHIHNISYTRKGRFSPSLLENAAISSQAGSEDLSHTEESRNIPVSSSKKTIENYKRFTINTPSSSFQTKLGASSMLLNSSRNEDQDREKVISKYPSFLGRQHLATDVKRSKLLRKQIITSSSSSGNLNVAEEYRKESFQGQIEKDSDPDGNEVEENEELEESRDEKEKYVREERRYNSMATHSTHSPHCTIS